MSHPTATITIITLPDVYAALCSLNIISNPSSMLTLKVTLYGMYYPYFTGEERSSGFQVPCPRLPIANGKAENANFRGTVFFLQGFYCSQYGPWREMD